MVQRKHPHLNRSNLCVPWCLHLLQVWWTRTCESNWYIKMGSLCQVTFVTPTPHSKIRKETPGSYFSFTSMLVRFLNICRHGQSLVTSEQFSNIMSENVHKRPRTVFIGISFLTYVLLLVLLNIFVQVYFQSMNESCDKINLYLTCSAIERDCCNICNTRDGTFWFNFPSKSMPTLAVLMYQKKGYASPVYIYTLLLRNGPLKGSRSNSMLLIPLTLGLHTSFFLEKRALRLGTVAWE